MTLGGVTAHHGTRAHTFIHVHVLLHKDNYTSWYSEGSHVDFMGRNLLATTGVK